MLFRSGNNDATVGGADLPTALQLGERSADVEEHIGKFYGEINDEIF